MTQLAAIPITPRTVLQDVPRRFMADTPLWYRATLIIGLILNPIFVDMFGEKIAAGIIVLELIATLIGALRSFPAFPAGLILFEAMVLHLVGAKDIVHEVIGMGADGHMSGSNIFVILLVLCMVTAVMYMEDLIEFIFTRLIIAVKAGWKVALILMLSTIVLSALMDALTVIAIFANGLLILVLAYLDFISSHGNEMGHDGLPSHKHENWEQFQSYVRGKLMSSAVGTMLGGCATMIGEPQNLLLAHMLDWNFGEFFWRTFPVSAPVAMVGLLTNYGLEKFKIMDYGVVLPDEARQVLVADEKERMSKWTVANYSTLVIQMLGFFALATALIWSGVEIFMIGAFSIVLLGCFSGRTSEHRMVDYASKAVGFCFLLIFFFGYVAMLHKQEVFHDAINMVAALDGKMRLLGFFGVSGLLSMISDNVFVAVAFANEATRLLGEGQITQDEYENIMIAINMGTNVPSIATPNGQAAFLFLLTLRPLVTRIGLSYWRMVQLAFPYFLTTTPTAALALVYLL